MPSSTASVSSYEDFYHEWFPRALRAARKRGLRDPEATAQNIMMVFFEKDYLDRYDPAMEGAVTFDSWVNAVVYNRLNNAHRDERRRAQTVEILDHDEAVEESGEPEFKVMAMEAFRLLRDRYGSELADVWVSVVKQVVEDETSAAGYARKYLIADHLGLGRKVVSERLETLQQVITKDAELREMLGADRWSRQAA
jgi:hypothetical protein